MKKKNEKAMVQAGNAWQALRVVGELVDGYDVLDGMEKAVTFFGSARINDENHPYYVGSREMGKIVADYGYNVITGGGPGLMEAANRGAKDSDNNVISCGIGIELPFEAGNNQYVDSNYNLIFRYFFIRKLMMMNFSDLYVGLPGGFGTIEEVFELITLMQTEKLPKKPVVLFGEKYWTPLMDSMKAMVEEGMAGKEDLELITIIKEPRDIIKFL
jgi:uncharacterized protein (TIGR00730 family)